MRRGPISVIVTTYRKPRELELVLRGYAEQDDPDVEVVVADDGSGEETVAVVDRVAGETGLRLVHVWHEDRGFRKTEILNRAIRAASGETLLFTDGDCVPRRDLVSTHRRLGDDGVFLSGGYVKLDEAVSEALTAEDVRAGRPFRSSWLRARGQRLGRRRLRLLGAGVVPALLDAVTPTSATFNGMNSSVARDAAVAVNGFDLELTYGGLDREFGQRLENLGLRGRQVRHRAVVVHLHHERPYRDEATLSRQREKRGAVAAAGTVRAERGLDEVDAVRGPGGEPVEVRIRRPGSPLGPGRGSGSGIGPERPSPGAAWPSRRGAS